MNRAGCPWRMIPNDLPPWPTVHQQAQRWIEAGCFEAMAHDLREVLRVVAERPAQPSAVILDGRTLQSTPESGHRSGYDGYKRKKGSKCMRRSGTTQAISWPLKVTMTGHRQERALGPGDLVQGSAAQVTGGYRQG